MGLACGCVTFAGFKDASLADRVRHHHLFPQPQPQPLRQATLAWRDSQLGIDERNRLSLYQEDFFNGEENTETRGANESLVAATSEEGGHDDDGCNTNRYVLTTCLDSWLIYLYRERNRDVCI